jgi:hypothetical protein
MMEIPILALGILIILGVTLKMTASGKKTIKSDGPICGCGHHFSYHSPTKKDCRAFVYPNWLARLIGDSEVCQCQQYVGPEPLPEYYG